MLNNLQHQAYKVNPLIFAVADHFYETRSPQWASSTQMLRSHPREPLGIRIRGGGQGVQDRAARDAENDNAQLAQKNWRTTEVMYVARKYADEERSGCQLVSFDYRGRVYFQNTALNPQGTDFDKALLYFADEGPVDEYWLAFQVATTYGHDKETMADQVQWTRDNVSLIDRVASDPIHNHEWRNTSTSPGASLLHALNTRLASSIPLSKPAAFRLASTPPALVSSTCQP